MDIGIIGGSASGLYSAILIKKYHPAYNVVVFERNDRVGKKLSATGNGHCNLLNKKVSGAYFHNNPLAKALFLKYPYEELSKTLEDLGVFLLCQGDLVYPMCYHAPTYTKFLYDTALSLGVEFALSTNVVSYKKEKGGYKLNADANSRHFDTLIFASGGKSQKKFGSDGSLLDFLLTKGYEVTPLSPSLCPVKVKEKVKSLSGLRHKAAVTVLSNGFPLYLEQGEVLFKDDGLSGIAIMNASSYLVKEEKGKKLEIILDLFPGMPIGTLFAVVEKMVEANPVHALYTWLEKPILEYLLRYCGIFEKKTLQKADFLSLCNGAKSLRFTYVSQYDFDSSQVSSGGIKIKEINDHFESKKEKGVYFVGEMVDVDGLCGGFNLSFALASALEVAKSL